MSCADLRPSGHGNAKSVILPSGIETIGASAFAMYSQNLTTFQIGNDATCIDLTKIKSIGTFGLANLPTAYLYTKDVKISNALKSIGSEAFKNNRFGKLVLTAGDYRDISVHSNAFGSLYLTNGIELESGVKNADAIIDAVLNAKKVTKFTQLFKDGKSAVYTVDYANKTVSLELSSSLNAKILRRNPGTAIPFYSQRRSQMMMYGRFSALLPTVKKSARSLVIMAGAAQSRFPLKLRVIPSRQLATRCSRITLRSRR